MAMPEAEYRARIKKVQNLLKEKGLDAGFVYYDELNIANGWYLSDWCPQFESGAVLVPVEGEPCICGGPESEPFAKLDSNIKDTRNVPVFMVPEEEYPGAYISSFDEIFTNLFGTKSGKKIGIVGMGKMPHGVYVELEREFAGSVLVDITDDFERLRRIKSKYEIRMIAKAFEIAREGLKVMLRNIKPGVPDYYPAGLAEGKVRSLGANKLGFQTMCAPGKRSDGVVPTTNGTKLRKGQTVLTGVSARYNGYNSAACLSVVCGGRGSASKAQKKYMTDVVEAFKLTREQLKPGNSAVAVDAAPRQYLKDAGYGDQMLVPYVHTIGLLEAEAPFFGPNSKDMLEPNMTVCIDVSLFGHPKLYGIRAETGYLITEKGCKPFDPYMDDLICNNKWEKYY